MMPIEPILEDIKQKFGTNDVRLPERHEDESPVLPLEASSTSAVVRVNCQKPVEECGNMSKAESPMLGPLRQEHSPVPEILPRIPPEPSTLVDIPPRPPSEPITTLEILSERPSETDKHPPSQQSIVGRTSRTENVTETSMAPRAAPGSGLPGNENEANRPITIGPTRTAPLVAHNPANLPTSVRWLEPLDFSIGSTLVHEPDPNISQRSVQPRRPGRFLSALHKIHKALNNLGRRIESFILRIECQRKLRLKFRGVRFGLFDILAPIECPPILYDGSFSCIINSISLEFWYCVRWTFRALANAVLNVLYSLACFPCGFWVRKRHRDLLKDVESLRRRQRFESMEMPWVIEDSSDSERRNAPRRLLSL
jgi:hypothetical protein